MLRTGLKVEATESKELADKAQDRRADCAAEKAHTSINRRSKRRCGEGKMCTVLK